MTATNQVKRVNYIIILISITIQTILWLKGGIWYGGDQNFIIFPGSSNQEYINAIVFGISNYPFLAGPTIATSFFWFWGLVSIFNMIPFIYSEYMFIILLFFVGSIYIYKLISEIILSKLSGYEQLFISLLISIVYMSNWGIYFADSQGSGITFLTIPFIYSLLSPSIYYIIKSFYENNYIDKLRYYGILMLLFMMLGSTSNIYNFDEIIGILIIISLGYLIIYRNKKNILNFLSILAIFFISNLYWIFSVIPIVNSTLSNTEFLKISYQYFIGNARPFSYVFFGFYNYTNSWIINLIASMILISISFLLINRNTHLIFWDIIYFLVSTLYSGIDSPFGNFYEYLFLHVPYFVEFRALVIAFGWLQGFIFSIITSISVFYAYRLLISNKKIMIRKNISSIIVSSVLLAIVVISLYPVMIGENYDSIHIPEYFIKTVNYINSQKGNFNVLALPETNLWIRTNWYYGNNLLVWFLNKPVFIGGSYDYANSELQSFYMLLNSYFYEFNSSHILVIYNLLYLLNIKYIILQGDAQGYNITQYLDSLNKYVKHGLLSLAENNSPYYVYRVNIDSSVILGSNSSMITSFNSSMLNKYNLSIILRPMPYIEINPSTYIVNNTDHYKYVIFLYSYNNLWKTMPLTIHKNFSFTNLFITKYNNIKIINYTYYSIIMQYTLMIIIIMIATILIFGKNILKIHRFIKKR
ncbi:hypothetical protein SULI_12940 [Saccharolobus solfataricus]|uniref:Membrane protein 6-pyruvoyl-tetrahydropterin synthase-related domain-containing protein n=2 Tax=Saccharolobus solfataricus TaxID=2287 RepID=A0A0E3MGJ7_SACSO|nr:hypothetical protein [Saccharolobus solfataricus]AKA74671.1 hypothetical protein SULB_2553 [Saccharolobus solfataricus]AKA77365.1 hypothetical protein SULC_2548 [Saccharolobus solfataricus]AKA80056.1 hypothetical protein SULA_2550 [Saccharolobus solfataricus]AZF69134.1 hypothetical protein SULG_12940 [Saccharolobus solfataricus]AZF71754.1 hypothetical protein SULH_12940 [Saccharolobus solfataricus]